MILDQIVADNQPELEKRKLRQTMAKIKKLAAAQPKPLDFASALKGDKIRLIAEVKKASPSKGVISADFNPVEIARIYEANGASAISVLTETLYFQGNLDYLKAIRAQVKIPLLRKDFIFDPYQIYEARSYGADALLLIVAILTPQKLSELLDLSHELGLNCLVEVHDESELEIALTGNARIIGINNRDLRTFNVDLATTERLQRLIPRDRIVVSESGIKGRGDFLKLQQWGINAALIGEAFMASDDIAAKMKEFL